MEIGRIIVWLVFRIFCYQLLFDVGDSMAAHDTLSRDWFNFRCYDWFSKLTGARTSIFFNGLKNNLSDKACSR